MKKIRAVFVGDVRFDQCPVFKMLIDKEMRYEKECVENDEDFIIFEVEADIATLSKS